MVFEIGRFRNWEREIGSGTVKPQQATLSLDKVFDVFLMPASASLEEGVEYRDKNVMGAKAKTSHLGRGSMTWHLLLGLSTLT